MSLTSIARAVYHHLRPVRTYPPTLRVYDVARDKVNNETVSKRTLTGMQTLVNVRYHLPSRPGDLASYAFTAPEDLRFSLYDAHHDLREAVEVVSGYRAGSQAREAMSKTLVSLHNKVDLAHDSWSQVFWDYFDVGADLTQQNANVNIAEKWLGGVPRLDRLPADINKLTLHAYVTLLVKDEQITPHSLDALEALFSRVSGIPITEGNLCAERFDIVSMPQPGQIRSLHMVREDLLAAFGVTAGMKPCKELEALNAMLSQLTVHARAAETFWTEHALRGDEAARRARIMLGSASTASASPPPVPHKPSGLSDMFGEMDRPKAAESVERVVEARNREVKVPTERKVAAFRVENAALRTQVKQLRDVRSRLQGLEDRRNAPPASLVLSEARVHAKL